MDDAVANYLQPKKEVWLLCDNLDKGLPTHGTDSLDILLIRSLLDASRKLQKQLEVRGVHFHSLVFLRNDVFDHLVRETPDKGKYSEILLEWADIESFQEFVRQRLIEPIPPSTPFADAWRAVFDGHVRGQDSFYYVVERTLMNPREILYFLKYAISAAINRGHERVSQEDLERAEKDYSAKMKKNLIGELDNVSVGLGSIIEKFNGAPTRMSREDVRRLLPTLTIETPGGLRDVETLLVWFGLLGVQELTGDEPLFAYQQHYDIEKLLAAIESRRAFYIVHPAFREALGCRVPA
jgi:hypothetical protein